MSEKLRPLFVVLPGSMTRRDIKRAEKLCGICIVESKQPAEARFLDPPMTQDVDTQARAAIGLFRVILNSEKTSLYTADLVKWFVANLINNAPPASVQHIKVKP